MKRVVACVAAAMALWLSVDLRLLRVAHLILEDLRLPSDLIATVSAKLEDALREAWNIRGVVDSTKIESALSMMMGATAAGPFTDTSRPRAACPGPHVATNRAFVARMKSCR